MSKIEQRVVLVTGSSHGIGKAIILRLADLGFRVVVNYNKSRKAALEVAAILKKKNQEFLLVKADISDERQVRAMVGAIVKMFHSLDVLVNNAGIIQSQPLAELDLKGFDEVVGTNLRGSVLVTKHCLPLLKKSKGAKIVFIVSSSAFVGSSTQFAYATSKAGLLGVIRALALELAPYNILVNGIAPGYINTPMVKMVKSQMDAGIKKIPMGRIGEPEEVAELVAFLASSGNTYMTGQCIHINGGRYMQ